MAYTTLVVYLENDVSMVTMVEIRRMKVSGLIPNYVIHEWITAKWINEWTENG